MDEDGAAERAEAEQRAQRALAARTGLPHLLISQDTCAACPSLPVHCLSTRLAANARLGEMRTVLHVLVAPARLSSCALHIVAVTNLDNVGGLWCCRSY